MATSYDEIKDFLDQDGVKYQLRDDGEIILGFATENYLDQNDHKGIPLVIRVEEDGEYLKVFSPRAYSYPDGPHKLALLQALVTVQWRTKLVQFEYDPADGEVRPIVEFPLEDARLTHKQLKRLLHGLAEIVDRYDPVIRKAMASGDIDFEMLGDDSLRDALETLRELASGNPAELREVLEELRRRRGGQGVAGPSEL